MKVVVQSLPKPKSVTYDTIHVGQCFRGTTDCDSQLWIKVDNKRAVYLNSGALVVVDKCEQCYVIDAEVIVKGIL